MRSTTDPRGPAARTVRVPDESALAPFARRLAASLPTPAFVTLTGDLGAGKTTLVKAVAAALGIDPAEVVSPTFGLIHVHHVPPGSDRHAGPDRIVHADLYRLAGPGDLAEIGWEDAITAACWVFVEWPCRAGATLPAERLDIVITADSPTARTFTCTPQGGFRLAEW
ncbi:MAG: tRNA (adenosine(37)-N6)-threonylcarbamoyltransferase complex ATPase subunit type 1 TsaE [Planctomycetia bacterium]|nr:tRNA (adenosine(37)-N6)-threonylcarbamoyltransferase complex ATPase subunit type 1 TsaE [Planctomycetia bacterium]